MLKILIAEDEAFIANLYKEELETHDTHVTIVENGRQAIDALEKEKFDLVLLDLLMPVMDGYSVLSHLKENKIRIPVVVVTTNLGQGITRDKCRQLGAEDFIVKSDVDASEMWQKIKIYLPVQ